MEEKEIKFKDQENLYDGIKSLDRDIDGLANFVQNDFDVMLHDGMITKNDIKEDKNNMSIAFDDIINKLTSLKEKANKFFEHYE